jgi:glycosyltransferase involved in cell wall biosynthesis
MVNEKAAKTCLIVSYGPVPTPKYQKIEGGGMRCWGLALGMQSKGYDVSIGINNNFPLDTSSIAGVHLLNWQEGEAFKDVLNLYDIVIINYSMGGPMSFVIDHLSDHVVLVLDCYVPIYIEVSARESADVATEYSNYSHDIIHYNKALKRGDYFLCANVPQKHMYMGVLGALGILNPYSYKKERILIVPFGVESNLNIEHPHNPYRDLGIKKDDFVLLWFGGLYPWFNIKPLLNTIKKITTENKTFKFVIVGGKNPFNSHPDFVKQYDTTYDFMKKNKLLDVSTYFVDWVDFADRINWFQNAKAVISLNNVGEENLYSWRTRVMDYVWGEIPMITNGSDPLSDDLIAHGAAIKLQDTTETTLYEAIMSLLKNDATIASVKTALLKQKEGYHWENVVSPLHEKLQLNEKPYLDEKQFRQDTHPDTIETIESGGKKALLRKLARAPRKIAGIVKRKGIKRSAKLVVSTLANRTKKQSRTNTRKYFFFSHPIDHTGAPLVLIDVIKDFAKHIDKRDINLVYPGGEKSLLNSIHKMGVILDKMVMGIGSRVIHGQLGIRADDFVLLNTVAVYPNYRDYTFGLLERGKLKKVTWFIHEDKPELRFEDKGLIRRIKQLIDADLLDIYVPSRQTMEDYNTFFNTKKVRIVTLRVTVPDRYRITHTKDDFNTIKFVISGTPSDGRKGQLLAIAAFSKFLNKYQTKELTKYRDFELHLISIGDDYISQQIKSIGDGLLSKHIHYYPKVSKQEAMSITSSCNATICSSLNETFALYVAEGMMMGHVLLRNSSSGKAEQIVDKKNGFIINSNDIDQFALSIAHLLTKDLSETNLLKMSKASQEIAQKFANANYWTQLSKK